MFSMGPFDGVKCNGHVQLSGRTTKKDRKGCKKEKIETVLKNRFITPTKVRPNVLKLPKINVKTKSQVIKPVELVKKNTSVDPVLKKPNVKDEVLMFKELLYNTASPTPPPTVDVPEQVENRLSTITELSPKKSKAKKRNKIKSEKSVSSGSKKPDKILQDPLNVNDKNQLSCNIITIPPKRKHAKLTNWQKDCGTRHETLQRILKECEKEAKLRENLYPLGKLII